MLKDIYSDKNSKQTNKIQHANYYTPEVLDHLKTIDSGEEAIKFFATYGNSTPIKYINCIRADSIKDESDNIGPPKPFRPYDLLVLSKYCNLSHINRFSHQRMATSTFQNTIPFLLMVLCTFTQIDIEKTRTKPPQNSFPSRNGCTNLLSSILLPNYLSLAALSLVT